MKKSVTGDKDLKSDKLLTNLMKRHLSPKKLPFDQMIQTFIMILNLSLISDN